MAFARAHGNFLAGWELQETKPTQPSLGSVPWWAGDRRRRAADWGVAQHRVINCSTRMSFSWLSKNFKGSTCLMR